MIILIFQVQHKPVCQVNLTRDIFLHLKEMAEVVCRVVASPAPSHYWWTFNNTFQLGRRPRSKEIQGVQEKLCLLPWPFKRMQDNCRVDYYCYEPATFWRTIAADSWQGREAEYRKFSSRAHVNIWLLLLGLKYEKLTSIALILIFAYFLARSNLFFRFICPCHRLLAVQIIAPPSAFCSSENLFSLSSMLSFVAVVKGAPLSAFCFSEQLLFLPFGTRQKKMIVLDGTYHKVGYLLPP